MTSLLKMPAIVILFRDVAHPPDRLFIDTSFIQALIDWVAHPHDPSNAAARDFYNRMQASNARMWTTPFTAEEILWSYVRNALFDSMRPFGVATIRDFKIQRHADYERTLIACQPTLQTMVRALNRLKISFQFPGENTHMRGTWGRFVFDYAAQLCQRFALETMDAFHIACAYVGGTSNLVSLDRDFQQIDGFTVFSYS